MAAAALGKKDVLRMQFHAALKALSGFAIFANPHITGCHTRYCTGIVEQHFGGCKSGVDFHTEFFGFRAQPATDIGERNYLVAVILKTRGQHPVRDLTPTVFGQKHEAIFGDGLV